LSHGSFFSASLLGNHMRGRRPPHTMVIDADQARTAALTLGSEEGRWGD
jgi:hypothetical protein